MRTHHAIAPEGVGVLRYADSPVVMLVRTWPPDTDDAR